MTSKTIADMDAAERKEFDLAITVAAKRGTIKETYSEDGKTLTISFPVPHLKLVDKKSPD